MSTIVINGDVVLKRNNATDAQGVAIPPTVESMNYGEIAINYNAKDACIFIKALDSNGQQKIVKFVGEEVIAKTLGDILGESAADLATLKEMIKLFEGSSSDVLTLVKNLQTEVGLKANKTYVDSEFAKKLGKTETAADSSKLGGIAASSYWRNSNAGTKDHNWSSFNNYVHNSLDLMSGGSCTLRLHTSADRGGYLSLRDMNNNQTGVVRGYSLNGYQAEFSKGNISIGDSTTVGSRVVFHNKGANDRFILGFTNDANNFNSASVWNYNNGDIIFGTANTERVKISNTGALVIGGSSYGTTAAPKYHDLAFRGHYSGDYARIRMIEKSGSSAEGILQFFVRRNAGSATVEPDLVMTLNHSKQALFEGGIIGYDSILLNSASVTMAEIKMNEAGGYLITRDINGNTAGVVRGYADSFGLQGEFLKGGIKIGSESVTAARIHIANKGASKYLLIGGSSNTTAPENFILWNQNSGAILFGTNDIERMKLTATGNLELGGNLIVKGETYTYSADGIETFEAGGGATRLADLADVDLSGAQGNFVLYQSTEVNSNGDRVWKARSDAKTWSDISGKPTTFTPVERNHIGSTYVTTPSDRALKTDLKRIDLATNTILSLTPYTYNWTTQAIETFGFKNHHAAGVIAQEIEIILPFAVQPLNDEFKAVDYIQIIPYLIAAFQELHSALQNKNIAIANASKEYKRAFGANEKLAKRVSELESELINLKNQIAA